MSDPRISGLDLVGGKDYTIRGVQVRLFSSGELATNLNRKATTIRRWEREGILPVAVYKKQGKSGDDRGKRRLYSRKQVEGLVRIAIEEKIIDNPHRPIKKTKFGERAHHLFKELARGGQ